MNFFMNMGILAVREKPLMILREHRMFVCKSPRDNRMMPSISRSPSGSALNIGRTIGASLQRHQVRSLKSND